MPYRLITHEPLPTSVIRVAREQIALAAGSLTRDDLPPEIAVHQARKHFKKTRALLRLIRDPLGLVRTQENAHFRDLGRGLAPLRNADALIERFDQLTGHTPSTPILGSIRAALLAEREIIAEEHTDLETQIPEILARLREARERTSGWPTQNLDAKVIARGFARICRRGRKTMKTALAGRTIELFHEWRKRVKDQWYQTRLLQNVHPRMLHPRRKRLRRLAELLGEDHDLALLERKLRDRPDRYGRPQEVHTLLSLLTHRQARLRAHCQTLGRQIHKTSPHFLDKHIRRRWPT